ncbi:longevity assurance proteins LAG1/LAC1 [Cylindrobasidium torrendii FP15055 ss-10]|uniref:Longevity assurance proteins LAG1/LAC1 n=1 Tax=Cylindrobasidium torrendii FP15055 ss-10 TaxID=1314674 RepID=A0A0D7BU15_9AGAR|nr:longevity assurance proteins LAG1/LAC1 [Cylindrobasidium torrendii FP15055 ss-10]
MATSSPRSHKRRVSVVTVIEQNPAHHLAGPFLPQTPIDKATGSPSPVDVRQTQWVRPPVSPWLRWAIHPADAFKIVITPVILFVAWQILAPAHLNAAVAPFLDPYPDERIAGNPFRVFFLISSFIPTSRPDDPRYRKSYFDAIFLVFHIFFWSMARQVITVQLCHPFARYFGIRKEAKLDRFGEQGYAMVYFFFMGCWGVRVMSQTPTWWYKSESFWIGYPHWDMIPELKRYYLMQMAYWSQQLLVLVLGLEKPRKDYAELVVHHLATIWLVGGSYLLNMTQLGTAVFASMDIPDTVLALSKILNYLQFETAKIISFATLIVLWTYFRHWLNLVALRSIWFDFYLMPQSVRVWDPPRGLWMPEWVRYQMFAPLLLLQCLNLLWYFLILRIAYRALKGGASAAKDDRSDDEDAGENAREKDRDRKD